MKKKNKTKIIQNKIKQNKKQIQNDQYESMRGAI